MSRVAGKIGKISDLVVVIADLSYQCWRRMWQGAPVGAPFQYMLR
jgi:hypothetical protein